MHWWAAARPAIFVAAELLVTGGSLVACGGGGPSGPMFPPYTGHDTELFDDTIEPPSVGYSVDPTAPPHIDNRLRERTQTGDAVVRAKVTTIGERRDDAGRSWQVGFHTVERLAGKGLADADFILVSGVHDQASDIIGGLGGKMVGKTFIVFVREFNHEGSVAGEPGDLRFHIAADSQGERDAVSAAIVGYSVH